MASELETLCKQFNIKIRAVKTFQKRADWPDATPWSVRLCFDGRTLDVPFYTGSAWIKGPSSADVLASLVMDASGIDNSTSFEAWATEYGYDPDSRKAEAIYKECLKLAPKVREFLGDKFEAFQNAGH